MGKSFMGYPFPDRRFSAVVPPWAVADSASTVHRATDLKIVRLELLSYSRTTR